MYKKTLIIIGIIFLFISIASATIVEPLSDFKIIIPIDDSMVAGEEKYALFEFNANYNTTIVINFTIEHPEICSDEWCGTIALNGKAFPDEVAPGVFSTGEIEITKGYYSLGIHYQSNSAVVPDNYNFSLEIFSEDVVAASSKKSRGGGGSHTFPTPTPTPVITPNETAIACDGGVTPTPTPIKIIAEQTQEASGLSWLIMIGIILILLGLLLAGLIIRRRRRRDEDNLS
ncbi:hypothetical protein KAU33_04340 [Candidatus Dependentiae bacterium]|nr:hypothetical protein [Candidatus Dependentiae bacterium]